MTTSSAVTECDYLHIQCTVNVTGETLVLKKIFPNLLGKCLLDFGKTLFSPLFQLNAGEILALCWQNTCLAPEFHQSCLQCAYAQEKHARPGLGCRLRNSFLPLHQVITIGSRAFFWHPNPACTWYGFISPSPNAEFRDKHYMRRPLCKVYTSNVLLSIVIKGDAKKWAPKFPALHFPPL